MRLVEAYPEQMRDLFSRRPTPSGPWELSDARHVGKGDNAATCRCGVSGSPAHSVCVPDRTGGPMVSNSSLLVPDFSRCVNYLTHSGRRILQSDKHGVADIGRDCHASSEGPYRAYPKVC